MKQVSPSRLALCGWVIVGRFKFNADPYCHETEYGDREIDDPVHNHFSSPADASTFFANASSFSNVRSSAMT